MRDLKPNVDDNKAASLPSELLIWMSPAFPTGAFAYSQGLETAVAQGWISDATSLLNWMTVSCLHGALRNDLVLMSLIMRADDDAQIQDVAELSGALQPSAERANEAFDQGRSFWAAYKEAWRPAQPHCESDTLSDEAITLPVAAALAAREHAISTTAALEAYAIAFATNQISAAIRLGVVGQIGGQRILSALISDLRLMCTEATCATEEDLGSATYGADLASLMHETQKTRLFRS